MSRINEINGDGFFYDSDYLKKLCRICRNYFNKKFFPNSNNMAYACLNCVDEYEKNKKLNKKNYYNKVVNCDICKKDYHYSGMTTHKRSKFHQEYLKLKNENFN